MKHKETRDLLATNLRQARKIAVALFKHQYPMSTNDVTYLKAMARQMLRRADCVRVSYEIGVAPSFDDLVQAKSAFEAMYPGVVDITVVGEEVDDADYVDNYIHLTGYIKESDTRYHLRIMKLLIDFREKSIPDSVLNQLQARIIEVMAGDDADAAYDARHDLLVLHAARKRNDIFTINSILETYP